MTLLSSCSLGAKEATIAKPDDSKMLVVYTCFSEDVYGPILNEFEETHDVWVKVVTGTPEEILERIVSEEALPACDIVFGMDRSLVLSYSEYFDTYAHFAFTPYVLLYNNDLVDESNITDNFFDSLSFENTTHEEIKDSVSRVSSGNLLICVSTEHEALIGMKNNKNLSVVYPKKEVDLNYGALIVRDCAHTKNAESFLQFIGQKNVQQYLPSYCYLRPIREDVGINRDMYPESEASHE